MPWPTPMHMVARAYLPSRFASSRAAEPAEGDAREQHACRPDEVPTGFHEQRQPRRLMERRDGLGKLVRVEGRGAVLVGNPEPATDSTRSFPSHISKATSAMLYPISALMNSIRLLPNWLHQTMVLRSLAIRPPSRPRTQPARM